MTFPKITHLDDVLPHIAGRSEFVHAQRDGYSVIDYNYALADSFDNLIRRECRGLKFAPNGDLMARPLHKFFNIGERAETQPNVLDFTKPHSVTEKLDGSMIHPAIVDGNVVFMTRMGRTDVARKSDRLLSAEVEKCCRLLLSGPNPATPVFEFTAPDNRVVVPYEHSSLTLLCIRRNVDGVYYPAAVCEDWATDMRVPVVGQIPSRFTGGAEFLAFAKAVTDREGFVVRWADGTWVKAKGEQYVLQHRARDSVLQEKNVLAMILDGSIDDILPLIDTERDHVVAYRDCVLTGIETTARTVTEFVAANDNLSQKEFATIAVPSLRQELRPIAFQVRAGTSANDAIRNLIAKRSGSQTDIDALRGLHGAEWAA